MINVDKMTLDTERLQIRPLRMDDFSTFRDYVPRHTAKEAEKMLENTIRDRNTVGLFLQDQLAGAVLFYNQKDDSVHLGFSVRKDLRNHGLMTEGLKAVVTELFAVQGIRRIFTEIRNDNHASISVVRKTGFRNTGEKENSITFMLAKES